jgi:hypothetical protein
MKTLFSPVDLCIPIYDEHATQRKVPWLLPHAISAVNLPVNEKKDILCRGQIN